MNVYLVITDLHKYYKDKIARTNYVKEIDYVEDKIKELISYYKSMGYNVILIFLGDIFDSSYREVGASLEVQPAFYKLATTVKSVFSVVGNHELTYRNNNPFWYLINNIKSANLKNLDKKYKLTKSDYGCINICDKLIDGEVEFLFNHYSTGIQKPSDDKVSIGLFHQDVLFRHVLDDAKTHNREVFELNEEIMKEKYKYVYLTDELNPLIGYKVCMFGHQHKLYGEWVDNDNNLSLLYLASLGRTNHTEVLDSFLERDIPAVIVETGKFIKLEHNKFNLIGRKECINEDIVKINRTKYERSKEKKELKKYVEKTDDPVSSVKAHFNNPLINSIIDNIIENDEDLILAEAERKMMEGE